MSTKYQCPTVGCSIELRDEYFIRRHEEQPHVACSCGWAGLRFAQHVSQQARRVEQGRKDPGEGVHELINMERDAEGVWRRVSGSRS